VNLTDLIVLILALLGGILGTKKELTLSLYQIIRSLTSLCLALHFYQPIAENFQDVAILSIQTAYITAYLFISLSIFVSLTLIIFVLKFIVEIKFISIIEKIFGFFIGIIHVFVLFSWLTLLLLLIPIPMFAEKVLQNSYLGKWCLSGLTPAYEFIVERFNIEKSFERNKINHPLVEEVPSLGEK